MSTLDQASADRTTGSVPLTNLSRLQSIAVANALTVLLTAFIVVTGLVRIDRYPATWFDEGSYLEVSRNIAEGRHYAVQSADGTLDYAPVISVGPTVLLPVAASIWLQGNTVEAGRAIALLFLILASFIYIKSVSKAFGHVTAAISFAVLVSMPAIRWITSGRQVAGEVPAVLFLLLGGTLAFRSRNLKGAAAAGFVLGMAIVTKPQYLSLLPLTLLIVCFIDLVGQRARPMRWYGTLFAGMAAPVIVWIATLIAIIGTSDIVHQAEILRSTNNTTLLVNRDLGHYMTSARHVLGLPAFFLVLPATLYGILLARNSSGDRRLIVVSIIVFQSVWLTWFVLLSNGWVRYAFPGLVVSTILMGLLLTRVLQEISMRRPDARSLRRLIRPTAAVVTLLVVALLIGGGAWRVLSPIATEGSNEAQKFALALTQVVPEGSKVDGWEPEVNYLADRRMVYPPVGSLIPAIESHERGAPSRIDSLTAQTEFLVIGEFGRLVGLYEPILEEHDYTLRLSIGRYELYQRNR